MNNELRRDPLSFEDIYEMYGERVLNLAYRMTGNEDTARDLTQDVFVKVYQNLKTFEQRSEVFTWLYRITTNHVLNHLKKEKRRRWVNIFDEKLSDVLRREDVAPTYALPSVPAADRQLEDSERAELVWSVIQQLPDVQRVPFVLYHYEGLQQKKIASMLDLSVPAVESRIHRAKQTLIKRLESWLDRI